jgi:hypothetical protein
MTAQPSLPPARAGPLYGAHESLPFTAPDQPADPTAQADPNDQLLIALKPEFTLRMIDAAYSTH